MGEDSIVGLKKLLFGSVGRKLFLGFLLIALLVFIVGIVSYISLPKSGDTSTSGVVNAVGAAIFSAGETAEPSRLGILVPLISVLVGTLAISL
ncbi:hypothetical protein ACFLZ6_02060, partial [Nanoarchaeota archaeon]